MQAFQEERDSIWQGAAVRYVFERLSGEVAMRFRLVVRGSLPPNKRGTVDVKHRLRREIHPQLKMLWQEHGWLKKAFKQDEHDGCRGIDRLANEFSRCGFRFAPLVNKWTHLGAALDILLLRRTEPHRVFGASGDLDGRVKTLLDALRMPQQCSEVDGQSPSDDEDPFYCLLEDDRLIHEFSVDSGRLLIPVEPNEEFRDVLAVISVTLQFEGGVPPAAMMGSFWPLGR